MKLLVILANILLTLLVKRSTSCQQAIVLQDNSPVFVTSPGFPDGKPYPTNTLCTWDISTYDRLIEVRFLSFDVEYEPSCRWDYVKLYSGPCGGNSATKYCGTTLPPLLLSDARKVCLEFYSDPIQTRSGFKARLHLAGKPEVDTYSKIPTSTATPIFNPYLTSSLPSSTTSMPASTSLVTSSTFNTESFKSTTGDPPAKEEYTTIDMEMCLTQQHQIKIRDNEKLTIFSPGYKIGNRYPVNLHCSTIIATTFIATLRIRLEALELEYHPACVYDRLVIRDGPLHSSSVIANLCGQHHSNVYLSTSNAILLEFHSDHIIPAAGFKMTVETVSTSTKLLTTSTTSPSDPVSSSEQSPTTSHATASSSSAANPFIQTTTTINNVSQYTPGQNKLSSLATAKSSKTPSTIFTIPTTSTKPATSTMAISSTKPATSTMAISSTMPATSSMPTSTMSTTLKMPTSTMPTSSNTPSPSASPSMPTTQTMSITSTITKAAASLSISNMPTTSATAALIRTTKAMAATTLGNILTSSARLFTATIEDTAKKLTTKATKTTLAVPKSSTLTKYTNFPSVTTHYVNALPTTYSVPEPVSITETTVVPVDRREEIDESHSTSIPVSSSTMSSKSSSVPTTTTSFYLPPSLQTTTLPIALPITSFSSQSPSPLSSSSSSTKTTSPPSPPSTISPTTATLTNTQLTTGTASAPPSPSPLPAECLGVDRVFSVLGIHRIQSPGMETGSPYPNDVRCSWVFISQDRQEIKLSFEIFDLEYHHQCKYDNLKIYNGSSAKSPVINQYCGTDIPPNRTLSGPEIYVVFTSDRFVQRKGFKLTVDIIETQYEESTCPLQQSRCVGGPCVPSEWFCDGEADCPDKGDELHCGQCRADEFRCNNGQCISTYLRCDGSPDCSGHEDESDCFSLTQDSEILIHYSNKDLPVCRDAWNPTLADLICADQFFSVVDSVWFETSNSLVHVGLKDTISNDTVLSRDLLSIVTWCPSNQKVHLKCQKAECGEVSTDLMQPYILGGSVSHRGQWPWTVALMVGNSFLCGGTLVADRWVVTAGHCVESVSKTPYLIRAQFGTTSLTQADVTSRRVMEVIRHPDHDFIYNADIALLHLQHQVPTNDFIRKACIPQQSQLLTSGLICYISGWGVTHIDDYYTTVLPDMLHYAKIKLWSHSKCQKAYAAKVKDSMFCAGYDYGGIDSCKGDSGGPLVCRVRNHWMLMGVTTWGESPCGQLHKPGVYTRVDAFRRWITNITQSSGPAIACDYENSGSCGLVDLSADMFMWTRQSGGVTATGRPAVDHTYQNTSGHYLYAEIPFNSNDDLSPAILQLPVFSIAQPSCLSLSYVFERSDSIRLKVSARLKEGDDVTDLWSASKGLSIWSTVNISIDIGVTQFNITAVPLKSTYTTGVAIDDVKLVAGQCKDDGHIQCDFNEKNGCELSQDDSLFVWELKEENGGRYMHFDGNNKPPRTKGVLYQPLGNMDSSYCVKVRYKMCYDAVLSIHTSFVYGNYVITGNAHWSRRYRLSDCSGWQQLSVPMSYKHYPHRVTIQGVVNSQSASISVDDFKVILGDCL